MEESMTLKELERKKKAGKIKDYKVQGTINKKSELNTNPGASEKRWIKETLERYCKDNKLKLLTEHRFDKVRLFRFDFAIKGKGLKHAFEYEGIYGGKNKKSRHTTQSGYSKDSEKYNLAAKQGWTVLRYTASTYLNLEKDLSEL